MEHLSAVPPRHGTVIFLNGTSSSGKSTIARELLRTLDGPYFHMAVDTFHAMRSTTPVAAQDLPTVLHRTWQGFHRAVAGMAAAGNDIVVDHVLSARWRLLDCLALLEPRDVVFVGVRCPLTELERREKARGDRPGGLAARQLEQVHAHGVYDIECDTSREDPGTCARRIREFLPERPTPTAFERLRGRGWGGEMSPNSL
jgi:chloramphenicol 3-O phosphotransferase